MPVTRVTTGDLLGSSAQTLVNTVNTEGVMGKGIALTFKERFPKMYADYRERCERREVKVGEPYVWYPGTFDGQQIINFPTKGHWRSASKLRDIRHGLDVLAANVAVWGVESLAVPPLGCGHGQLEWRIVGPTIYEYLNGLNVDVELYAPHGTLPEELTINFVSGRTTTGETEGQFLTSPWVVIASIVGRLEQTRYTWRLDRPRLDAIVLFATLSGVDTGLPIASDDHGVGSGVQSKMLRRLVNNDVLAKRGSRYVAGDTLAAAKARFAEALHAHAAAIDRSVDLVTRLRPDVLAAAVAAARSYAANPTDGHSLQERLVQSGANHVVACEAILVLRELGWLGNINVGPVVDQLAKLQPV